MIDPAYIDAQGGIGQGQAQVFKDTYDPAANLAAMLERPKEPKFTPPNLPKTGGWEQDQPELMQNYDSLARHVAINAANKIDVTDPRNGKPYVDWTTASNQHLQNVQKSEQHKAEYLKAQGILQNKDQYKALENPEEYRAQLEAWKKTPLAQRGDIPTPKFKEDVEKDADKNLAAELASGISSDKTPHYNDLGNGIVSVTTTDKFSPSMAALTVNKYRIRASDKLKKQFEDSYEKLPDDKKQETEQFTERYNNAPNSPGNLTPQEVYATHTIYPSLVMNSSTQALHNKPTGGGGGTENAKYNIHVDKMDALMSENPNETEPIVSDEEKQRIGGFVQNISPQLNKVPNKDVAEQIYPELNRVRWKDNPYIGQELQPIKVLKKDGRAVLGKDGKQVYTNAKIVDVQKDTKTGDVIIKTDSQLMPEIKTDPTGFWKQILKEGEYEKATTYGKGTKRIGKEGNFIPSGQTNKPTVPISQQENKQPFKVPTGGTIPKNELIKGRVFIKDNKKYVYDGSKFVPQ